MDFFRENRFAKEVFLLYNQESKKICAEQESPELATACLEKRKMALVKLKIYYSNIERMKEKVKLFY